MLGGAEIPTSRYTRAADGAYLAYQVFGSGDTDLLYVPGWFSHLEVYWEQPQRTRFVTRLASSSRVITFDERGTGLSERTVGSPHLDTALDDVRAVLDAAGAERPVLLGEGPDGGGSCAMFAASFPERTLALIWWSAHARSVITPDYPWGDDEEALLHEQIFLERAWGSEESGAELLRAALCPSLADDPAAQRWIAKLFRYGATPGGARTFQEWYTTIDVRGILPAIRVPTLIVQDAGRDALEEARYIAERVPGARVGARGGIDLPAWLGDMDSNVAMIEDFIESVRDEERQLDRVLATILFTDVVRSTDRASELGDRRWAELLERHNTAVRAMLGRYRGTEVKTTGDGFLATFDGPARAVKCAQAICEAVKPLGLEVRAGCHTGEIELLGVDVGGIAVHIGARIAALAGPSEVLVSSTVKDLVAGSGLVFKDRGEHRLKGVPDPWHLYAAAVHPDRPHSADG